METYYKLFDQDPETGKLYPCIASPIVDYYPRNKIITRPKGWGPFAAFRNKRQSYFTGAFGERCPHIAGQHFNSTKLFKVVGKLSKEVGCYLPKSYLSGLMNSNSYCWHQIMNNFGYKHTPIVTYHVSSTYLDEFEILEEIKI